MVQRARGLRLGEKPGPRAGVAGELRREELQRDRAQEPRILGLVDDSHASLTELLDDPVMEDLVPIILDPGDFVPAGAFDRLVS